MRPALLGVEPDRFLPADHALQLAFDAPEHLLGEIGLIFAEEVARHDGRAKVPGHRPGLVGVGEPAKPLVEILEIDHGMIPVVDGEVATQPGPSPTGRGQSWTAKSNRRDSRSTETDDDRRRRRLALPRIVRHRPCRRPSRRRRSSTPLPVTCSPFPPLANFKIAPCRRRCPRSTERPAMRTTRRSFNTTLRKITQTPP